MMIENFPKFIQIEKGRIQRFEMKLPTHYSFLDMVAFLVNLSNQFTGTTLRQL